MAQSHDEARKLDSRLIAKYVHEIAFDQGRILVQAGNLHVLPRRVRPARIDAEDQHGQVQTLEVPCVRRTVEMVEINRAVRPCAPHAFAERDEIRLRLVKQDRLALPEAA